MTLRRGRLFLIILFIIGFDALSKYLIHLNIPPSYSSAFFPYGGIGVFRGWMGVDFSIVHVINRGGAWGMLASKHDYLLLMRIVIITALIIYLFAFNRIRGRMIPFAMIIGGALGNVIDCFVYQHVIDMFYFNLWGYSFPVFNIADAAISLGVAFIFIHTLFSRRTQSIVEKNFNLN